MKKNNRRGFSQLEVLAAVVIIAVLSLIGFSVYADLQQRLLRMQCANKLRSIGSAMHLYAVDHGNQFPRSWHSAAAYREPGWAMSIVPYFGVSQEQAGNSWKEVFNAHFRSPVDTATNPYVYSYALNVFFELDPTGDSYVGSPQSWRNLTTLPRPDRTVLMAQGSPIPYADHLMCHMWSGLAAAKNALNHSVHDGRAHYLFVSGHVDLLELTEVFDPGNTINLFNPLLAQ